MCHWHFFLVPEGIWYRACLWQESVPQGSNWFLWSIYDIFVKKKNSPVFCNSTIHTMAPLHLDSVKLKNSISFAPLFISETKTISRKPSSPCLYVYNLANWWKWHLLNIGTGLDVLMGLRGNSSMKVLWRDASFCSVMIRSGRIKFIMLTWNHIRIKREKH